MPMQGVVSMSVITSEAFAQKLIDLGIVENLGRIRRVVIDAQGGHVLIVHVEYHGDTRWLEVIRTLDGVEVRTQPDTSDAVGQQS
jgi:hypothetical protein